MSQEKPTPATPPAKPSKPSKPSKVEAAKAASNYLRGDIPDELVDGKSFFSSDSIQLLKHHGTYQQDNRDERGKKSADGGKSSKAYSFMVRVRIPGGKLTGDQLLAQLDLCEELANDTLRITTRQGLQFHGVVKSHLKPLIRRINDVQLSTLAACGDVERNVMCCPAPYCRDPVHHQLQQLADRIAEHLAPRTTAYHEIWLTDESSGEKQLVGGGSNGHEIEPIYGRNYLPRKFKTAIGLPGDNCVDLYSHDLGLMAICEDYNIVGYNVLVGGGFGVTPSAKKTFPAIAKRMCFATPDEVLDVATAIVKVQRDFGDRSDRKVARLKYLIHNWGLDRFKAKVEAYLGRPLPGARRDDVFGFDDHMGWYEQGNGRWFYGLNVENGRIHDTPEHKIKSAIREICQTLRPNVRLTSHQSLLFTDLDLRQRKPLEEILKRHNVPLSQDISNVRRWSMACVALPTCGLAITESERFLPQVIDELEVEVAKLGLSNEEFTVRMTGCPNGCARPYNADIGLVGKTAGKYTLFVGGRLLGDRLNTIYQDLVPGDEIVSTLVPILVNFKENRQPNERLGDFCHRQGVEALLAWSEAYLAQTAST